MKTLTFAIDSTGGPWRNRCSGPVGHVQSYKWAGSSARLSCLKYLQTSTVYSTFGNSTENFRPSWYSRESSRVHSTSTSHRVLAEIQPVCCARAYKYFGRLRVWPERRPSISVVCPTGLFACSRCSRFLRSAHVFVNGVHHELLNPDVPNRRHQCRSACLCRLCVTLRSEILQYDARRRLGRGGRRSGFARRPFAHRGRCRGGGPAWKYSYRRPERPALARLEPRRRPFALCT